MSEGRGKLMRGITNYTSKNVAPYLHNLKKFVPVKSQVLYSGAYWDHNETVAAIDSLLHGSWLVSGAKINKFENTFAAN